MSKCTLLIQEHPSAKFTKSLQMVLQRKLYPSKFSVYTLINYTVQIVKFNTSKIHDTQNPQKMYLQIIVTLMYNYG